METLISQAAEAVIIKKDEKVIKRRISKGYRINEIDEKLRKLRTRSEAKILERLKCKVNVPRVFEVDERKKEILMDFLDGKKLSEHLEDFHLKKQKKMMSEIGKEVAKIHDSDIIHGDLTTSNMILIEKKEENEKEKIFFIDFGLGFHSSRIEDKAVDIHLLKQALESRHFANFKELFEAFLKGYKKSKNYKQAIKQFEKVESRGRYKH